jgi:hypothetical protein
VGETSARVHDEGMRAMGYLWKAKKVARDKGTIKSAVNRYPSNVNLISFGVS